MKNSQNKIQKNRSMIIFIEYIHMNEGFDDTNKTWKILIKDFKKFRSTLISKYTYTYSAHKRGGYDTMIDANKKNINRIRFKKIYKSI